MQWQQAKDDYINGALNLKQISEKYGIKYSAVLYRSKKEGWEKQPETEDTSYETQTDTAKQNNSIRQRRILELSDMLLDKIKDSISELDKSIVKTKERQKNIEYDSESKKPINETVEESEKVNIISGMVDKTGIKQLVSTLKDIKDIHMDLCNDNTGDEQVSGVVLLGDVDEQTLEGGD